MTTNSSGIPSGMPQPPASPPQFAPPTSAPAASAPPTSAPPQWADPGQPSAPPLPPGPYAGAVPPHDPSSPYGALPPSPAPGAGFGQHPGGPPAPGGKGMAIAAFVVAMVALTLAWVPFLNYLAAVLAVVALVLGIVAVVQAVTKGRPGKGFAIAAVAIGVVALLVALTTQFLYGRLADELVKDIDAVRTEQRERVESSTAPEAVIPSAADLVLVESNFGQDSYDPSRYWYVVVVDNPNPQHAFVDSEISVEAVGVDGTILDSDPSYVNVRPGRFVISGRLSTTGGGAVDHLEVLLPQAVDAEYGVEPGEFAVSDTADTSDKWSTTVVGTLSSSFADDQEYVMVTVVARDAQGVIVGSGTDYIERLPAGGQARFDVMFTDEMPMAVTYEVYASR